MDPIELDRILDLMTEDEALRYRKASTEAQRQQVIQSVVTRIGLDVSINSPAQVPVDGNVANVVTPTTGLQTMSAPSPEAAVASADAELAALMGRGAESRKVLVSGETVVREKGETRRSTAGKAIEADEAIKNLTQSFVSGKTYNGISYEQIRRNLIENGVVTPDAGFNSVQSMFKTWVGVAASVYDNGNGPRMTVTEMINSYGDREGKAYAASLGMAGGPTTSTTRTYTEYDVESALSIAESAYGKALGKKPSKKQIQNVVNELNRRAKAAPSVATTTRGAGGDTVVSYGGGISPTEIAEQVAEADPLFAETDFVSNFLPIIEKVFKNPIAKTA